MARPSYYYQVLPEDRSLSLVCGAIPETENGLSAAMVDPLMIELSARIAANTAKVNGYLASHGFAQLSFDLFAPSQLLIPYTQSAVTAARQAVIHDCLEPRDLIFGTREHLTSFKHNELIS